MIQANELVIGPACACVCEENITVKWRAEKEGTGGGVGVEVSHCSIIRGCKV